MRLSIAECRVQLSLASPNLNTQNATHCFMRWHFFVHLAWHHLGGGSHQRSRQPLAKMQIVPRMVESEGITFLIKCIHFTIKLEFPLDIFFLYR